jgi:hypothetical protein
MPSYPVGELSGFRPLAQARASGKALWSLQLV